MICRQVIFEKKNKNGDDLYFPVFSTDEAGKKSRRDTLQLAAGGNPWRRLTANGQGAVALKRQPLYVTMLIYKNSGANTAIIFINPAVA